MDILMQALAAIGTLGIGTWIGSWISDRRRDRREDKVRWLADRRSVYERLLTGMERWVQLEYDLAENLGALRATTGQGLEPPFEDEFLLREADEVDGDRFGTQYAIKEARRLRPLANAAREEVDGAVASIEMISDRAVVDAALALRDAGRTFVWEATTVPPRDCGGWSESGVAASNRVDEMRVQFVEATRKELGVV